MDKGRLRRHSSSTTLSKPDPRYAGLSDAAADAAWRQDIAEVFGDGPDGFEAGRDNLTAYRNEMNTIRAAHGDLRWGGALITSTHPNTCHFPHDFMNIL